MTPPVWTRPATEISVPSALGRSGILTLPFSEAYRGAMNPVFAKRALDAAPARA